MRVHGEIVIRRRSECKSLIVKYSDQNCRDFLKEDFFDTCGYCGKKMELLKAKAQVDHFIPQSFAPKKINDYENLVYSCQKCNRGKWHHWPTKSLVLSHDDNIGFVDPASSDFDMHLKRSPTGSIIAVTPVGKYMVEKMKFDIRPIGILWKIGILNDQINQLTKIINEKREIVTDAERLELLSVYFDVNDKLKKLLNTVYGEGESI